MEEKLRTQVAQLLTPMLGEGNFTSEIQVELDMDQVTSARESYDKDGVGRGPKRSSSRNRAAAAGNAVGVPGALSNTPPPAADRPKPGRPARAAGTQAPAPAAAAAAGQRRIQLDPHL